MDLLYKTVDKIGPIVKNIFEDSKLPRSSHCETLIPLSMSGDKSKPYAEDLKLIRDHLMLFQVTRSLPLSLSRESRRKDLFPLDTSIYFVYSIIQKAAVGFRGRRLKHQRPK
jgi:hypothetical protein